MYSFSYLEPVCCSMFSSNCCFLTCIQISQEVGQVVWYSHLFQNFPQFVVIHIVKEFVSGQLKINAISYTIAQRETGILTPPLLSITVSVRTDQSCVKAEFYPPHWRSRSDSMSQSENSTIGFQIFSFVHFSRILAFLANNCSNIGEESIFWIIVI